MQYTHACDIELNDPIVITVNNNMNIRIMKDLIWKFADTLETKYCADCIKYNLKRRKADKNKIPIITLSLHRAFCSLFS